MTTARETIQALARDSRFLRPAEAPTHRSRARNAICGDQIEAFFRVEDDVIVAAWAQLEACLVARASWNLLASLIEGKSVAEAMALARDLQEFLCSSPADPARSTLLDPLAGFRQPSPRRPCAALAANAVLSAFEKTEHPTTH